MRVNRSELRALVEEVAALHQRTLIEEVMSEAPGDVWARQYKKMQGQFKTLQKELNAKLKDLDKQWASAPDDGKNKILLELVSMRRKLMELTK